MIITKEIFKDLDALGGKPYTARGTSRSCLGFAGLPRLLRAIRECSILPTSGWCAAQARDLVHYYHPGIFLSTDVVDNYYFHPED